MSFPSHIISADTETGFSDGQDGIGGRCSSWCVCFVRFAEPCSMGAASPFETLNPLIIENDCVGCHVSRPKGNFAKTASLTMRVGQIYFQNATAPGDWVFIWMSDQQEQIDQIVEALTSIKNGGESSIPLNDWKSGLKFAGRVLNLNTTDTISSDGVRTVFQNVECQAFLEFSTSIYYTFVSKAMNGKADGTMDPAASNAFLSKGLSAAMTDTGEKFLNYMQILGAQNRTPDRVIALLLIFILGIDSNKNPANLMGAKGALGDAIHIPPEVGSILGRPGNQYLWEVLAYYGGLQQYGGGNSPGNFAPIMAGGSGFTQSLLGGGSHKDDKAVIQVSDIECKGFIPEIFPPIWDNRSLWDVLSQFLNPAVNEMFTSFRVNKHGRIMPSITVREIPFGTGLFDKVHTISAAPNIPLVAAPETPMGNLAQAMNQDSNQSAQQSITSDLQQQGFAPVGIGAPGTVYTPDVTNRAEYRDLPRWIINENVIVGVNTSTSEARRVNFVQVWGKFAGREFTGFVDDPQKIIQSQFIKGNFVHDQNDIQRHGLRADIVDTEFDYYGGPIGSLTGFWARMRADWYFNGHLKLFGSITTLGITAPIAEGDNVLVRGVLYHIEGLDFTGSISPDGKKQFMTTIHVSNGLIAKSLDGPLEKPAALYYNSIGGHAGRRSEERLFVPGVTDIQLTSAHKTNRDENGDQIAPDGLVSYK